MSLLALLLPVSALQPQPAQGPVHLPDSYRRDVVRNCAPATVEAAGACLRQAMSAEDFAVLSDRIPARRFRGFIDCEIETAWHLADSQSPMGGEMDRLLGVHAPGFAAGMIISDVQERARSGRGFPFEEARAVLNGSPPPSDTDTTCNADTTPPKNEARDAH